MKKFVNMSGTPWHVGFLTKDEGDPKRHRGRCVHFDKETKYCSKCHFNCIGSAHCRFYVEKVKEEKPYIDDRSLYPKKELKSLKEPAKPFVGIKNIKLSDVEIDPYKFKKPSKEKVDNLIEYYKQYATLDKPIIVSCEGTKYALQDKYLRFYVAEKLGLTEIPAKIGTLKSSKLEEQLKKVGTRIYHKVFGNGVVTELKEDAIIVKFENGKESVLSVDMCVQNNLLQVKNGKK